MARTRFGGWLNPNGRESLGSRFMGSIRNGFNNLSQRFTNWNNNRIARANERSNARAIAKANIGPRTALASPYGEAPESRLYRYSAGNPSSQQGMSAAPWPDDKGWMPPANSISKWGPNYDRERLAWANASHPNRYERTYGGSPFQGIQDIGNPNHTKDYNMRQAAYDQLGAGQQAKMDDEYNTIDRNFQRNGYWDDPNMGADKRNWVNTTGSGRMASYPAVYGPHRLFDTTGRYTNMNYKDAQEMYLNPNSNLSQYRYSTQAQLDQDQMARDANKGVNAMYDEARSRMQQPGAPRISDQQIDMMRQPSETATPDANGWTPIGGPMSINSVANMATGNMNGVSNSSMPYPDWNVNNTGFNAQSRGFSQPTTQPYNPIGNITASNFMNPTLPPSGQSPIAQTNPITSPTGAFYSPTQPQEQTQLQYWGNHA
jgi:hypothetical protein